MTKHFLLFFGIELPTTQANSKSSENISHINTARVLEFNKDKKGHLIIYSFVGVVTVHVYILYFLCSFDSQGHDLSADCWSLGILIFELLTGR